MNKIELKHWIGKNLTYSRGLVAKKCNIGWFSKYGFEDIWNSILTETKDIPNPTFPQRIWHIIHDDVVKCASPTCQNTPTFFSFARGYLRTCSPICAQYDPQTIKKIKSTNVKMYGAEYGLQTPSVIAKRKKTLKEKYNVSNISQVSGISEKKKQTCLKNYGTEWFLGRQDLKEKIVMEKYGVKNVQKVPEISLKSVTTKKEEFYSDELINGIRFKGKVSPAFTLIEYKGTGKRYNFKCEVCSAVFEAELRYDRIPRCIKCYPTSGTSLFEQDVYSYIRSILTDNIVVLKNDKKTLVSGKELDIYIPSKKLAIECDGLYWHGEVTGSKTKTYHFSKTEDCQRIGINLIHIFEDEWISKKDIVKSKLKHLLKLNTGQKIFARKCKIRELGISEKKLFLEENHIQGNDVASISLGLFLTGQLVAVMTLCKSRIFTNPKNKVVGEYELSRYAALKNCSVLGGASKLLSHFIKQYKPAKIVSYADRRWSMGNLYEKLGFKKINEGTPNYWYFGRGNSYKRHHRFGFAKHTLAKRLDNYNPSLTEWQNMKTNGWDRIWDCGSFRYEMTF